MEKSADAFRTISEVAEDLDLPQHVLRFWETRFPQIKPLKRAGGRRFYRPADVRLLAMIRKLLYDEGYTIKGVQRLLKEQGVKVLQEGFAVPAPNELAAPHEPLEDESGEVTTAPPASSQPVQDPERLRAVLAVITECEAILRAARRSAA
ncbi:MAG: MerR family transcriptional regulator [Beijerinckiaceae bacterium]|nr:MerR family transcriptional regulator [Beijerinckiaceae bacterium]